MVQIVLGPSQLNTLLQKANQSDEFHRLLITMDDHRNVTASAINNSFQVIRYGGEELTIPGCPYPPDCVTIKNTDEKNKGQAIQKCILALKEEEEKNGVM